MGNSGVTIWGHHGGANRYAHWMCGEASGDFLQPSPGGDSLKSRPEK